MPRLHDDRLPMIFASSPPLPRGCSNQWADQCADYGQSDALPEGIDRPVHHGAPQLVGPPTLSGALVSSGNFRHRGLHFCGSCDGVGMINGHSRLQQTAASAPGGLGSVIAAKTASTYLRFGHRDRDHNPAFSGRGRPDGGTNLEKRQ